MTARTLLWMPCVLAVAGCSGPASQLNCNGDGEVTGSFSEINSGSLQFEHGLAWRESDHSYTVLFTGVAALAEAGRVSPDPETEVELAAQMLGELVVGYRFTPDGRYHERITLGTSTSSGWSGADRGRIRLHDGGCLRGSVRLDHYGQGAFALPLTDTLLNLQLIERDIELDSRIEAKPEAGAPESSSLPLSQSDPLAAWSGIHARLHATEPSHALEALSFSPAVAARLGSEPRTRTALERLRGQCPEPTTAVLNEFADVTGESHPSPGIVLEGTVLASEGDGGAFLRLCYVMKRNGEFIDQCFPLSEDCSIAPGAQ